jgi:hypothetical protein
MVTVFQTSGWPTDCLLPRQKYIGSFFSVESAEEKLGVFFLRNCCEVTDF